MSQVPDGPRAAGRGRPSGRSGGPTRARRRRRPVRYPPRWLDPPRPVGARRRPRRERHRSARGAASAVAPAPRRPHLVFRRRCGRPPSRRSPPLPGKRDDALREGWQPRDRAEQVGPRQQVGADLTTRRPGGTDLHLDRGFTVGEPREALRDHPRDRAGLGDVAQLARVQGVDQPGPADRTEHRVAGQLGLQLGASEGHRAPLALPRTRGRRSWSRTNRPEASSTSSSSADTTSPVKRGQGAIRCGAGPR